MTGRYVYEASGREDVRLGGLPACGWNVGPVTLTVRRDAGKVVFDQQIGTRLERTIHDYRPDGVYLSFAASTVTCVGVKTTSEDTYSPPPLRFPNPLVPGDKWETHATLNGRRTEDATLEVLRRETVTVPAGTYDTFVVRMSGRLGGSQKGTVDATYWFDPPLGFWVKESFSSSVERSGSRFVSSYTTALTSLPG